jgi:hypothetical protein
LQCQLEVQISHIAPQRGSDKEVCNPLRAGIRVDFHTTFRRIQRRGLQGNQVRGKKTSLNGRSIVGLSCRIRDARVCAKEKTRFARNGFASASVLSACSNETQSLAARRILQVIIS